MLKLDFFIEHFGIVFSTLACDFLSLLDDVFNSEKFVTELVDLGLKLGDLALTGVLVTVLNTVLTKYSLHLFELLLLLTQFDELSLGLLEFVDVIDVGVQVLDWLCELLLHLGEALSDLLVGV